MLVTQDGFLRIYMAWSCYLKSILTSIFTLRKVALLSTKLVSVSQILVLTTIKNRISNTSKNIVARCLSLTRLINFFLYLVLFCILPTAACSSVCHHEQTHAYQNMFNRHTKAFFQLSLVLLNIFMNWGSNVA